MLVTLVCAAAAGCAPETASHRSGGAPLEMENVRFYRHDDEQSVFRVSKTQYCLVADPAQMAAFGGFDQVRVVPPSIDFRRGKKAMAGGYCPSP